MDTFMKFVGNSAKAIIFTFFCGVFISFSAYSQDEKDKNFPEVDKEEGVISSYENPGEPLLEYSVAPSKNSKESVNVKVDNAPKKENQIYRQGNDKEIVKKENVSTLSFNLFIYIMDKFKEDQKQGVE
ncbi:hypothetical protein [Pararhodonellum marinum]|uniref:hypothetical protein n=1 Tax=Pararhodonellum marinum TaxID=2755358 RepID=UPI00188E5DCB|nr:hypothetical protein [Pararhodonellum marinum]